MLRTMSAGLLAFVLTAMVACSADEPSERGEERAASEEAIRDGHVETGQPAVGLLMPNHCTGTLIAPDLVLTAGHCVPPDEIPVAFFTGQGRPVTNASDAVSEMQRHAVHAAEQAPGYDPGGVCSITDVGLVKLAAPVQGIAPASVSARVPRPAERCVTVGFGWHFPQGATGTTAHKRSATVAFREERETTFAFDDVTGGTDSGDSGGPLFCDGEILAVNSCGNRPDLFARLDRVLAWIEAKRRSWAE